MQSYYAHSLPGRPVEEEVFWGHSKNDNGRGVPEGLRDHINRVAKYAGLFATPLTLTKSATIAAILHDIGKYSESFNRYVRGETGFSSPDHWSAGARIAISATNGSQISRVDIRDAIRLAIESHHGSLTSLQSPRQSVERLTSYFLYGDRVKCGEGSEMNLLVERWRADGFSLPNIGTESLALESASAMLDTRMLFSCLVDADFLATEGHFNGNAQAPYLPREAMPKLDFAEALEHVRRVVSQLPLVNPKIQSVRSIVSDSCYETATSPTGVFTLTAPTGAGKTFAMLLFALRHAAENKLNRIIFVMPFLTIIDQTVKILRSVLRDVVGYDERWILEDHSLANNETASDDSVNNPITAELAHAKRLAAENWDAPIIITSSVKCLEGLHANRPSHCRRLHRLGKSVLLFDEVQTVPPKLATLTLATLNHLSQRFGSSVVFSTATQPAFDLLKSEHLPQLPNIRTPEELCGVQWQPKEIVPSHEELFKATAARVRVNWLIDEALALDEVALRIAKSKLSTVAIVNLKRHARELFREISDKNVHALHLSTSMCAAHREAVLNVVRSHKKGDQPVKLVSTQCIEAGVDVSFQEGWRSFAPLDSVSQAAGRINRSFTEETPANLFVFKPKSDGVEYPPGYSASIAALETLLNCLKEEGVKPNDTEIISSPEIMRRYYSILYSMSDEIAMSENLCNGLDGLDFEAVRSEYRIINTMQRNILVPYDQAAYSKLLEQFHAPRKETKWLRKWLGNARPHTVSIYEHEFKRLELQGVLQPLPIGAEQNGDPDSSDWWFLAECGENRYDDDVGLKIPEGPEFLVI